MGQILVFENMGEGTLPTLPNQSPGRNIDGHIRQTS